MILRKLLAMVGQTEYDLDSEVYFIVHTKRESIVYPVRSVAGTTREKLVLMTNDNEALTLVEAREKKLL